MKKQIIHFIIYKYNIKIISYIYIYILTYMADFDPNATQNQTADSLFTAPPIVTKTVTEQLPEGCTKVLRLAYWQ